MPSITISETNKILVDGQNTGFAVGTDQGGVFLTDDRGENGEFRFDNKSDALKAFRFTFFV